VGFDAVRKAERTAEALIARARMLFKEQGFGDFSATNFEVLGAEASYGSDSLARGAREVVLRLVVDHGDPRALDVFARQLGAVGLSFAQGTAGLIGGRPKPTPLVRLFTFFIDKSRLEAPSVTVGQDASFSVVLPEIGVNSPFVATPAVTAPSPIQPDKTDQYEEVELRRVAHARSGDKGNSSNIAILCRKPEYVSYLRTLLTPERIAAHFATVADGPVVRYEAPGLSAFNFVLQNALGGGGMASARIDPQGKAYGQRALEMRVKVPRSWIDDLQHSDSDPSRLPVVSI
jgi:hypothetical protein